MSNGHPLGSMAMDLLSGLMPQYAMGEEYWYDVFPWPQQRIIPTPEGPAQVWLPAYGVYIAIRHTDLSQPLIQSLGCIDAKEILREDVVRRQLSEMFETLRQNRKAQMSGG